MTTNTRTFDSMLVTALWATTDFDGNPLDDNFGPEDVAPEAIASLRADLAEFLDSQAADLAASGLTPEAVGHNFWLTREGHGAGFWDLGLGAVGDRLTAAANAYGDAGLYVGDDGLIYC